MKSCVGEMGKKRRIRVSKNLVKYMPSGIYYYRKGDEEISLGETNEKKALKKKDVLEAKLDFLGPKSFTLKLKDTYEEHLSERRKELKKKVIREGTFKEFQRIFENHLIPVLGTKKLAQIDPPSFRKAWPKFGVNDLTNVRKVLSFHMGWCCEQGYLKYVPKFTIPPVKRRKRRILKPEEIKKIFSHAEGGFLLFLSMALFMGMRRGEITKLSWDRINLAERFLILQEEHTKTKQARAIPINEFVFSQLSARLGSKSKWVFPNREDSRRHMDPSGFRRAWIKVLKLSDMEREDITWHDFRATYEYYAHKRTEFTDTQKEKFAGSSIEVQKRLYVSFDADDVRGLEDVVQVSGMTEIFKNKKLDGENTGND